MDLVETNGDIMDHWRAGAIIGITTNGFVKRSGQAVMGAGIAKSFRDANPGFDLALGRKLQVLGNEPMLFPDYRVFTFPVKHNWWEEADLDLIDRSARIIADRYLGKRLDFVRPGTGNGKRSWEKEVRPILQEIEWPCPTYVWDF
jgi:hypothetical protein